MYTILENQTDEIIINKSKFIGILYKINNVLEAQEFIKANQDKYHDATHVCYAYIVNNQEKVSDDNEPQGTAGMPILSVLKKNHLTNILVVVIRYFGGIKLGSGGLIRAYSSITSITLEQTQIIPLKKGFIVTITFNYDKETTINKLIKKENIIKKEYQELITYHAKVDNDTLDILKDLRLNYKVEREIIM